MSDLTCSLKITGSNLKPVTLPVTAPVVHADSNGDVFLSATNAALHGSQLQLETRSGLPDIGYWDNGDAWVSWTAQIPKAGTFNVSATVATPNADAGFVVEVGGETFNVQAPQTGSWDTSKRLISDGFNHTARRTGGESPGERQGDLEGYQS